MNLFSQRVFGYAFGIALSVAFAVALAIIVARDVLSVLSVLVAILASLAISAAIAALIAGYRLPLRWGNGAYRAVMRRLAKKAIRASLSQAMTPIGCTGILETELGVAIKVQAGQLQGVANGARFNVYESTGNRLWGIIVAIEVRDNDCDCVPYDRVNEEFWAELENRMRTDTSAPPNVHLVLDVLEPGAIDDMMSLLDNWR